MPGRFQVATYLRVGPGVPSSPAGSSPRARATGPRLPLPVSPSTARRSAKSRKLRQTWLFPRRRCRHDTQKTALCSKELLIGGHGVHRAHGAGGCRRDPRTAGCWQAGCQHSKPNQILDNQTQNTGRVGFQRGSLMRPAGVPQHGAPTGLRRAGRELGRALSPLARPAVQPLIGPCLRTLCSSPGAMTKPSDGDFTHRHCSMGMQPRNKMPLFQNISGPDTLCHRAREASEHQLFSVSCVREQEGWLHLEHCFFLGFNAPERAGLQGPLIRCFPGSLFVFVATISPATCNLRHASNTIPIN